MVLDYFGVAIMTVLGGARLYQILSGKFWELPLFFHAMISALLLVLHSKTKRHAPLLQRLVAWASALLPFAIQIDAQIPFYLRGLSLIGVVIAIWTIATLGKAFDVTPADRGLVVHGPYKWVRHPMYCSELFSIVAMVLADLSIRNILVTLVLAATLILRIKWEEEIISGYQSYSQQVRDRLIPGVW